MTLNRSWLLGALGAAAAAAAIALLFLFSPGRQLDRAFSALVHAAENRDWKTVRTFLAEDYRDQWGMDREQAIALAAEGFRHFLVLEITPAAPKVSWGGRSARIDVQLALSGRGSAVGEAILEQARTLTDDFQFAWQRKSWKPWDWKLVSINQREIEIDPTWMP